MDTKQIKYFVSLAKSLNFSQAAKASGVTQPALSKAIKKLEKDLGGNLIHRDGKDSRLTELGTIVLNEFESIIESEKKALEVAELITGGYQSIVKIGIANTLTPKHFSQILFKAAEVMPQTKFILQDVHPNNVSKMMLAGKLDCCFLSDYEERSVKLDVIHLYTERLFIASNTSHRFSKMSSVPIKEIGKEIYLDRENCEFRSTANKILYENDIFMAPVFQSSREDWIQQLVADGLGICTLPQYSKLLPDLALRPIDGLDLYRNIHFVTISGSTISDGAGSIKSLVKSIDWP